MGWRGRSQGLLLGYEFMGHSSYVPEVRMVLLPPQPFTPMKLVTRLPKQDLESNSVKYLLELLLKPCLPAAPAAEWYLFSLHLSPNLPHVYLIDWTYFRARS